MSQVLRAIPTRYKNILFRSKLEADWAITLDELGILWEYEPEGRYWGDVFYAPDFWLPTSGQWFEVKGVVRDEDCRKWLALARNWEGAQKCPTYLKYPSIEPDAVSGAWAPPIVVGVPDGYFRNAVTPQRGVFNRLCLLCASGFVAIRDDYQTPVELMEIEEPEAWWGSIYPFPYRTAVSAGPAIHA